MTRKPVTPKSKTPAKRAPPVPEKSEIEKLIEVEDTEKLKDMLAEMTEEQRKDIAHKAIVARNIHYATHDTARGFKAFYELVHGNILPRHAYIWIKRIYRAHTVLEKGNLIYSWRGSWKTTTISATFVAWRIGWEPHRANLIVQANDAKAEKTAEAVANIIEHSTAWKVIFPHVVPDIEKAWGANGYEVKRTDMEYAAWREMNAKRIDPTLIGLGVNSHSLIGLHPDGVLMLDDVHDEDNSASPRQRYIIVKKVTGTILPFVVKEEGGRKITWFIAVGTPWDLDDVYHYLQNTGEYDFLSIPLLRRAEEGEEGNLLKISDKDTPHDDIWGVWRVSWPEHYPLSAILSERNTLGRKYFHQMMRLDLIASRLGGIRYMLYPNREINRDWRAAAGVDYASYEMHEFHRPDPTSRSQFALCYIQRTPTGKAVITDGIIGYYSQSEAETYVKTSPALYPNWNTTAVEMNGKGEEFYTLVKRNPGVRLLPFWTGRAEKNDRFAKQDAPLIENGIVAISDSDTPFLNALRDSMDRFPDGNTDVRDAVHAAIRTMPDLATIPYDEETETPAYRRTKEEVNPCYGFAEMSRR